MFNYSQSVSKLVYSPAVGKRSKHIKYHFIRQLVLSKVIEVKYCNTEELLPDSLTNPVNRIKHNKCIKLCGGVRTGLITICNYHKFIKRIVVA